MNARSHRLRALSISLFALASLSAQDAPAPRIQGESDYQTNCMACHLVDTPSVGPSLIRMMLAYPEGKTADFIAWAKNPGKKDPNLIQMPAMVHVPDEALERIHHYALTAVVGKKEKKRQFPDYKEPQRELPYITRSFLPNASPASLAVILKDNISLCWDTEACRLRYAWEGSKTLLRAFRAPANLPDPFYKENADQLWSFGEGVTPQFHGYKRIDRYPEFHYSYGSIEIREKVKNGATPGSIVRHFALTGVKKPITLNLSHFGEVSIASDKGSLKGNTLHLNPKQAQSFSLSISK